MNNNYFSRTNNIDIKEKFIWQKIDAEEICLEYLSTDDMVADMLTKAVIPKKIEYFRISFGLF